MQELRRQLVYWANYAKDGYQNLPTQKESQSFERGHECPHSELVFSERHKIEIGTLLTHGGHKT